MNRIILAYSSHVKSCFKVFTEIKIRLVLIDSDP